MKYSWECIAGVGYQKASLPNSSISNGNTLDELRCCRSCCCRCSHLIVIISVAEPSHLSAIDLSGLQLNGFLLQEVAKTEETDKSFFSCVG